MAELSLWLDDYDDIYSDFDSRYYPKRRVSEDFLYELKTALKSKEQPEDTLSLFLPSARRNEPDEKLIVDSLSGYFHHQFDYHAGLCRNKLRRGLVFLIAGMAIMVGNAFISYAGRSSFIPSFLRVILEPAGWFFLWASLEFLFYDFREMKKERDFFGKLASMKIVFHSSANEN